MQSLDALLTEALKLPLRDRALLAEVLDESLDDAAWTTEIDHRLDAFANAGDAVDGNESLERVRQVLALHRRERGTQ